LIVILENMLSPVITVDLHQHLWPDDVLRTRESRVGAPCARA
jgi:hypothetical protein